MKLEKLIQKSIFKLDEEYIQDKIIDFNKLKRYSKKNALANFRGYLVEELVYDSISKIEGLRLLNHSDFRDNFYYKIRKDGKASFKIIKKDHNFVKQELDLLFEYENKYYIGEVKSTRLNNFSNKKKNIIKSLSKVSNKKFEEIFLFMPICDLSNFEFKNLKSKFDLINLDYDISDFKKITSKIYSENDYRKI